MAFDKELSLVLASLTSALWLFVLFPLTIYHGYQYYRYKSHIILQKRYANITMYEVFVMSSKLILSVPFYYCVVFAGEGSKASAMFEILYYIQGFTLAYLWVLRFYLIHYDINFTLLTINFDWKSLLNCHFTDTKLNNFYIKYKNKFGNYKYLLKKVILPLISVQSLIIGILFFYYAFFYFPANSNSISLKIWHTISFVANVSFLFPFLCLILIYVRTPKFNDYFYVTQELQKLFLTLILTSIAMVIVFFYQFLANPSHQNNDDGHDSDAHTHSRIDDVCFFLLINLQMIGQWIAIMFSTVWVLRRVQPIIDSNEFLLQKYPTSSATTSHIRRHQSFSAASAQQQNPHTTDESNTVPYLRITRSASQNFSHNDDTYNDIDVHFADNHLMPGDGGSVSAGEAEEEDEDEEDEHSKQSKKRSKKRKTNKKKNKNKNKRKKKSKLALKFQKKKKKTHTKSNKEQYRHSKRSRQSKLFYVLQHGKGFELFMHHLGIEFSIECLLAFVELLQYQQCIFQYMDQQSDDNQNDNGNHNGNAHGGPATAAQEKNGIVDKSITNGQSSLGSNESSSAGDLNMNDNRIDSSIHSNQNTNANTNKKTADDDNASLIPSDSKKSKKKKHNNSDGNKARRKHSHSQSHSHSRRYSHSHSLANASQQALFHQILFPSEIPKSGIVFDGLDEFFVSLMNAADFKNMMKIKAFKLYKKYIERGADFELNLSYQTRKKIEHIVKQYDAFLMDTGVTLQALLDLFDRCSQETYSLLTDSFERFTHSVEYEEFKKLIFL